MAWVAFGFLTLWLFAWWLLWPLSSPLLGFLLFGLCCFWFLGFVPFVVSWQHTATIAQTTGKTWIGRKKIMLFRKTRSKTWTYRNTLATSTPWNYIRPTRLCIGLGSTCSRWILHTTCTLRTIYSTYCVPHEHRSCDSALRAERWALILIGSNLPGHICMSTEHSFNTLSRLKTEV